MLDAANKFDAEIKSKNYRFNGILTTADKRKFIEFKFGIPENTNRIKIEIKYNEETGNIVTATLFDSFGKFRGRGSKRSKKNVIYMEISNSPTAGIIPGSIKPGTWTLELEPIDIYGLCLYDITIKLFNGYSEETIKNIDSKKVLNSNRGWYKGELHMHSIESDGIESVPSLIGMAEEEKLDFISITDHNTISQWSKFVSSDKLVLIKGIELSTYNGHANVYGVNDWIDWRIGHNGLKIDNVIDRIHDDGGIMSINHPCAPSIDGHLCWSHQIDYNKLDAIEILNAPWLSINGDGNIKARKLWDKLLNSGYRIAGIGGSDLHQIDGVQKRLGYMTTYVYCENLSAKSIIDGIRNCKAFVTMGPYIDFTIENNDKKASIGGSIESGIVKLNISVDNLNKGNNIVIIKDGEIEKTIKADKSSVLLEYTGNLLQGSWYRVEVHENTSFFDDGLIAITNPIWGR